MKHDLYKLKCCDEIVAFNSYGQNLERTKDCMLRSLRIQQLTGYDLNFGMVFHLAVETNPYSVVIDGYGCAYSYHVWTEYDNVIYDSCRQYEEGLGLDLPTDEYVMMFDISHYKRPNTPAQAKLIYRDLKNKLMFAKSKAVPMVYFGGFRIDVWNLKTGRLGWMDWDWFNDEADSAEEQLNNFLLGKPVRQLYDKSHPFN